MLTDRLLQLILPYYHQGVRFRVAAIVAFSLRAAGYTRKEAEDVIIELTYKLNDDNLEDNLLAAYVVYKLPKDGAYAWIRKLGFIREFGFLIPLVVKSAHEYRNKQANKSCR